MPRNEFYTYGCECAKLMDDKQASNIVMLDLQGISSITDYFLFCSCEATPHLQVVCNEVRQHMRERGIERIGMEGTDQSGWMLLDYSGLVIHVFFPEIRRFYSLESVWADAPSVPWEVK